MMTNPEKQKLERIHEQARLRYEALTAEQRIARLKRVGILDANGKLSSRYGGDGDDTSTCEDRPAAH